MLLLFESVWERADSELGPVTAGIGGEAGCTTAELRRNAAALLFVQFPATFKSTARVSLLLSRMLIM
jgi:hypothetical protein